MGTADIIPGVSGGTIALIVGIYDELIRSLSQVNFSHIAHLFHLLNPFAKKNRREQAKENLLKINWPFLLPLFGGIIGAVLIMSKLIPPLLKLYPALCFAFFFGLILLSIPALIREVELDLKSTLFMIFFASLMFFLVSGGANLKGSTSLPYVFMAGALAISAMILPGISGSYILVILGEYYIILEALDQKNLSIISVFLLGIIVGVYSFLKILRYLLKRHRSITMASMIGIMLGSLKKIWPYHYLPEGELAYGSHIQVVVFISLGALLSVMLHRFGKNQLQKSGG